MLEKIIINSLYLLALINPVSKISVLSAFPFEEDRSELIPISIRSTVIALFILMVSMIAGEFVLRKIFKVNLYSLKIGGGMILFWSGFGALSKGVFFGHNIREKFSDISVVPLACPLIAGPATITAVITLSMHTSSFETTLAILLAIFINTLLMFLSSSISKILIKFNILGALIRLTGLIVVTIGVQMILEGISAWMKIMPH